MTQTINESYWALEDPNIPRQDIRRLLLEAIDGKTSTVFREHGNGIIYSIFDVVGDNAAAQLNPYHIRLARDGENLFATLYAESLQDDVGMAITKLTTEGVKRIGSAIFPHRLREQGLGTQLDMARIDYALLDGYIANDFLDYRKLPTEEAHGFAKKAMQRLEEREQALRKFL
ncbi:hypothetical protein GOV07_05850 [Candidatus Woesearchaeota archaeon]|nr:hypothetical protein [Candidatus Woesearchaeota archaeon]